jgi:hypothetical protein
MILPGHTHESLDGYVFPTDEQSEFIMEAAREQMERIPVEHQIDCNFIAERAIDMAFEHGWFFDAPDSEKILLISRDAREGYDVQVPFTSRIDEFLFGTIRRAAKLGADSRVQAYNDLMPGKE